MTHARWRHAVLPIPVIVGLLLMAGSAQASPSPVKLTYTGGEQSYTVPNGVTVLEVEMVGAFGGPDLNDGGDGTEFTAYLPVSAGEVLYGEVGQDGSLGGSAGFGGGGAAGTASAGGEAGGSGGGASDVRTCSLTAASCPGGGSSLGSRLIVAGGGGGEGGSGLSDGIDCGNGPYGGSAEKYSPGGIHVQTATGLVITGGNSEGEAPSTPADGGGSTAAGDGGVGGACGTAGAISGSNAGQAGSGPLGGAGATAIAKPGGGGGGGGGYFGGGGGASGQEQCAPTCTDFVDGAGGAAGSSFITASAVLAPLSFDDSPFPPSITFTPAVEIDSPTNGAQYTQGQSVPVSFTCNIHCSATVGNGQPLPTSSAGPQTFTVTAEVNETPITSSVSYTVIASTTASSSPPPAGLAAPGTAKSPPPTKVKPLTSSQKRAKAIAACKKLKNAHKQAKCIATAKKRYPLHPKTKHKKK